MRLLPSESARVVLLNAKLHLIDHVIIGSPSTANLEGWFSFKAAGYL